jgi:glycine cleavage system H lipoate-binding protein
MEAMLGMLGLFAAGLLARLAVLVAVVAVIAVPLAVLIAVVRGVVRLWRRHEGLGHVGGLLWSRKVYYAPGHTWVESRRGLLRVGVDDLAQRLFGRGTFVALPAPGTTLRAGEVAMLMTAGDKRAEIRSPVDGVVRAVNRAVAHDPALIHRAPYGRGWLFTVAPANDGYRRLMRGDAALAWLRDEGARFNRMVEASAGLAAADGGELVAPAPALLTEAQWSALTRAFLESGKPADRGAMT